MMKLNSKNYALIEDLVRGVLFLVPCQPQAGFFWTRKKMNEKFMQP